MEKRNFVSERIEYVLMMKEVKERKKFELVENIMGFMYGWIKL
jgi:hypothetical protein